MHVEGRATSNEDEYYTASQLSSLAPQPSLGQLGDKSVRGARVASQPPHSEHGSKTVRQDSRPRSGYGETTDCWEYRVASFTEDPNRPLMLTGSTQSVRSHEEARRQRREQIEAIIAILPC
ncbi:hypothetical protein SAMD00023353_6700370 [Rosellinia necatrix]|uniref:Uncharacterized protein n=1 Tax=Rosellinia necatrix TaxID=77044 RepID=A0A1W2TTD8_ROSNE|nr:hypothetical protein SAMD00023353_6700370 [Rosellinia necatrix]